ncbi:hypothetical protein HanPI659440_Chr17g0671241 [Helianthus annuus]|nr:hypothetical protein HanPI659440_Chr17g0671241 [Helianthus annuus]
MVHFSTTSLFTTTKLDYGSITYIIFEFVKYLIFFYQMTVLMVSFLFIYLVVLPSSQLNSKRDIGNHLVRQQMEKVVHKD